MPDGIDPPPPAAGVIGRRPELAAVEHLLARAAARRAGLVIQGEPGIGKTTLWRATTDAAAARGWQVLSTRPAPLEAALPLSGFGDLFGSVAHRVAHALSSLQRRALEAALLIGDPAEHPADQRTLSVATVTLLRVLSEAGHPVLIAIDDVQWLDASSAALLAYALRRLADSPVGMVATLRGGQIAPTVVGLRADTDPPELERCLVGPMSIAALHQLLMERLGRSFSRLLMVRIATASNGNPFHTLEIGRTLNRSERLPAPGEPLPVEDTLGGLMRERLVHLPSDTRAALLILALAAEPATLELMARAGIASPDRSLSAALRESIVTFEAGRIRFTHPLLAPVVVALAGRDAQAAVHRMLSRACASEEARALHRAWGCDGPDEEAAAALEAAATRARRRGAPLVAGEMLEIGRSLTPPSGRGSSGRRARLAAVNYFEAGEGERASRLLEDLVATLGPGIERAITLQLQAQVRARSQSFADAITLATRALEDAGDDAVSVAGIEMDLGVYSFSLGDLPGAGVHIQAALSRTAPAKAHPLRAEALACASMIDFWFGRGPSEIRMAEALALEDLERIGPLEIRPRYVQALLLLWSGDLDAAVRMLLALRDELVERGEESGLPFLSLFLVVALLWRGDLPRAEACAQESWDTALLNGEAVARALALSARALVSARRGRAEETRAQAHEALGLLQAAQFHLYSTWPLWSLGVLELSLGDAAGAARVLAPLCDSVTAMQGVDPILGIAVPEGIEALAELGEPDRAEPWCAWLERGGAAQDRPWALALAARGRGIVSASRGDLAAASACLDAALDHHRRLDMPFELARTLLIAGRVHRRLREKRRAAEALGRALHLFEEGGAAAWATRARAELRRVGLRPRAPSELTETERRVAELAARGMTNREVAVAAFLSPKTVDNVLSRVYRKLDIASRAELGAVMAALTGTELRRDR
ncbi:MAG: AAA family ATPase [Candidatus Dormiibacterota bacterium]